MFAIWAGAAGQLRLPILSGVMLSVLVACSGNGDKDGKVQNVEQNHEQHQSAVPSAPPGARGQWMPVAPPNWVWVPEGQSAPGVPAQEAARQRHAYPPVARDSLPYGRTAPRDNPWAVSRYEKAPEPRSSWGQAPAGSSWSAPGSEPRFRPLDEARPARQPQPAPAPQLRQAQSGSAWQAMAPYDRPYGSSANPGYPAAQGYGSYPSYGAGMVPYSGYGGLPGYGGAYPTPGIPGVGWPGGAWQY